MKHWMFQCREISKLVSQSMDFDISWQKKLGIRMHLMMCRLCTRHKRQLEILTQLMNMYSRKLQYEPEESLPHNAKTRIKLALSKASQESA